jgi:hypothetical protein
MKFHSSLMTAVAGAALFAIAVAPPAFAKKVKSSGSFSVGCLTSDTALQDALGITDSSAPVNVTVSPGSLWPPNHKMHAESFTVNLTNLFTDSTNYPEGADILVWISNITDDQLDLDGPGGHSCGKKTAKQGPDWSPAVDSGTTTSYLTGSTTDPLTDTTPAALNIVDESSASAEVDLRRERCAREGTRTYTITVVCCDLDSGVCDDPSYQGIAPSSAPSAAPTASEDLNVQVLKSRKHHGKP